MKIREALLIQTPSLALQRAASDEISRLDAEMSDMNARLVSLQLVLRTYREREATMGWAQS